MVYSKEQKIKIIEWWFETKCYATVRRRYAREFDVRYVRASQQKFIQYMVQKFMTKGTVLDCRKEKAGAPITARSPANVDRVHASVRQSPKKFEFEDSRGRTVTVNGERYREVSNQINENLNQLYTPNQKRLLWFQQDGATPHTAHATMAHLRTLFGNRIWSLQAELEWSLHYPDLAPIDFFFWDAAKAEVYKEKFCSLRQLKQAVESFTQSVTTDTCCRMIENFAVCINACANRNGAHIENINYKKFA